MENNNLTKEEINKLKKFTLEIEKGEMAQVDDLFKNCNSPFSFAKTHSNYVKDWEKTKRKMENKLQKNILPPNTSLEFNKALIEEIENIMSKKLQKTQMFFNIKFNESIFNYLGTDGKTKFLGIF